MKEISRQEIQKILAKYNVIKTCTVQKEGELEVAFFLSDNQSFLVRYDRKKQRKRYFIEEKKTG